MKKIILLLSLIAPYLMAQPWSTVMVDTNNCLVYPVNGILCGDVNATFIIGYEIETSPGLNDTLVFDGSNWILSSITNISIAVTNALPNSYLDAIYARITNTSLQTVTSVGSICSNNLTMASGPLFSSSLTFDAGGRTLNIKGSQAVVYPNTNVSLLVTGNLDVTGGITAGADSGFYGTSFYFLAGSTLQGYTGTFNIDDVYITTGTCETPTLTNSIVNKDYVDAVAAAGTFGLLSDVTGAYTTVSALYAVNASTNGLAESTTLLAEPSANQFKLTRGTSDLLVQADLTVEATAIVGQDTTPDANVQFNQATLGNAGLIVGASTPFSDSSGTLTLQNIDALDSATESTVEAAIDTLANLTSVQGQIISIAGTLTVETNAVVNQDVTTDATPTFSGVNSTGNIVMNTNSLTQVNTITTIGNVVVGGDITQKLYTDDVSNPPTEAELDAAIGTNLTAGFNAYLHDNSDGTNFYHVVSDGGNWWIFTASKAL